MTWNEAECSACNILLITLFNSNSLHYLLHNYSVTPQKTFCSIAFCHCEGTESTKVDALALICAASRHMRTCEKQVCHHLNNTVQIPAPMLYSTN